jgi:8-oxo-dGTP pyrophosphatase MutT (NUDIX family)
MRRYVMGLAFSPGRDYVVLMRKRRPDWQKGKLNGLGGEIREGETPHQTMVREWDEETSILTMGIWGKVCTVRGSGHPGQDPWELHVFATLFDFQGYEVNVDYGKTDEKVEILPVNALNKTGNATVDDLPVMIALAETRRYAGQGILTIYDS